jgi:hypothetical protein
MPLQTLLGSNAGLALLGLQSDMDCAGNLGTNNTAGIFQLDKVLAICSPVLSN